MKKLLAVVLLSLAAVRAYAVDGVFIEYGQGNNVSMARLGTQWEWQRSWLGDGAWLLTASWEVALGAWRGHKPNDNNQTVADLGVTPVFRLVRKEGSGMTPYLELGIMGLHLIRPTFIYSGRKFGSAFQFGHLLGFGVNFGDRRQFVLGYRFQHLSNAGIVEPNQGINFSELHFVYRF